MRGAPRVEERTNRSAVILFSQTFPFGQGEEFLEAEIPHLLDVFDKVVVVPTLHSSGMAQTRQLPERAELVKPDVTRHRQAAVVAAFCLRHPLSAIGSALRAIGAGPNPRRIRSDLRFDLHAVAVSLMVAKGVTRALRDVDQAILYGFWLHTPARVALDIRRRLRLTHVPVVSRANGFDLYTERHPYNYLPQRNRLLDGLDRVFAASETAEDYLRQRYPEHAHKITSARIGTQAAINPGNPDQKAMHVVSCSYIAPVKRLKMLIDDLAEAQHGQRAPITWTHIGSGPQEYAQEVTEYASRHLEEGSFRFLGHMSNTELRHWYAENPASVFAHVSESEGGLAASIQEALAQGLPVIATTVGGVKILSHDRQLFDGRLRPEHSPAEFADRLRALMATDTRTYASYVTASIEFWKSHCSADVLGQSFAQRLMAVVGEQGNSAETEARVHHDRQDQ